MSATIAPSPWPAPAPARQDGGWRFGCELSAPLGWLFDLRRNVSITPRQLMGCYLLLCTVSLVVAAGFWLHGVTVVSLFTGLELLAVGAALLAPKPAFSTMTATAILGFSTGAKASYRA